MTAWGMYVELPNTIEGMIHVTALADDYYHYDEAAYEMVGETGGRRFKLGQTIQVVCASVNKFMRTIDFIPVEFMDDWFGRPDPYSM